MQKVLTVIILLLMINIANAQELYVFSEPASNMPAKSLTFKMTGRYANSSPFKHRYLPEAMLGINKKWMLHFSTSMSDFYTNSIRPEAAKLYVKYRFFSQDQVHRHFRMAAFADVATSANNYFYQETNLEGDNSGYQFGLIATQLFHKLAISGTMSYTGLFRLNNDKIKVIDPSYKFVNYSLSAGYLILPVHYKNYKQLNMNAYIEILGNKSLENKNYLLDVAPAIQFIFNSNSKLNAGYRFQLAGNSFRMANSSFQLSFEHTFFNIWK